MELTLDPFGAHQTVRWCRADAIAVGGHELQTSFLLTPTSLIADWPPAALPELRDEHLDQVLALDPEVVLLGTGERHRFPPPAVMARFLSRGIGFEAMDNAAAARTFNLLAGESRRVVAAFLLPG